MKRILAILFAAVMCTAMFGMTACGTVTKVEVPTVDPNDININLDKNIRGELEIMVPGGNQNERTMIECLIGTTGSNGETYPDGITFSDLFPNVDVNLSYVSVSNYASAVGQQQLAGTLPDIVWSNTPDFYDLMDSHTFIDIKPYAKANEMQDTVNTYLDGEGKPSKFSYNDDFYTEFFDMSSVNDKCYVVPRSCDSVITFLNTDILTKAGVDLNPETTKIKNGWSWDDFMEVCATVRAYMDSHGASTDYVIDANLTGWLSVCYPMLVSYGGGVLDEKGNVILDSEGTRKCMAMVKEMVDKRYINDSTVAVSGSYDNGHSAMIFQSASVSLYAERRALKDKVDMVSFPLINDAQNPKIGAGVAGYAINSASEKKELAWAFLTFMLSEYGQQRMALSGLNLASIRKDLSDPLTANWGKEYASLNLSAYTWGSQYKIATDFFVYTDLTAKAGIERAITQLFTSGTNSEKNGNVDALIKTAVDDINQAMISY